MIRHRFAHTALVATLLGARTLAAQGASGATFRAPESRDPFAGRFASSAVPVTRAVAARPLPWREDEEGRPGIAGRVARAVVGVGGGVVVGGFLGYFASQMGHSDWEDRPAAEKTRMRRTATIDGAALGAVAGYFLRPRTHVRRAGEAMPMGIAPRAGRQLMDATELRRSIATNVLEAVQLGRPEWIKGVDPEAARDTASGSPVESRSVVVYVGDERMGPLSSLRDVSIPEVAELRYFDRTDARRRWGVDARHGAIEVVPASVAGSVVAPAASTGP